MANYLTRHATFQSKSPVVRDYPQERRPPDIFSGLCLNQHVTSSLWRAKQGPISFKHVFLAGNRRTDFTNVAVTVLRKRSPFLRAQAHIDPIDDFLGASRRTVHDLTRIL
jgi:hypothetical protein